MHPAGLYVVATPIGNLEDISYRAVRLLSEADVVAAEDTRRSRILLDHYQIQTALLSLHEHNEQDRIPQLVMRIQQGELVALISDAGTPLISDPGYRLVRAVAAEGLRVIPIPGASALTAALSVAGLATDRFAFEGFLPAKSTARQKRLLTLSNEPRTLIFFESSHRVSDCLRDMKNVFTRDRRAVVCRELTKQFETVLRGTLGELLSQVESDRHQSRGEFVILIEGSPEQEAGVEGAELARALLEFLPSSQAARVAAKLTGARRRDLYSVLEDNGAKSDA